MTKGLSFTENDLESLAEQGSVAVLRREVLADLLTPVTAFAKTAARHRHAFLLESVEGGENVARYSFLGGGARRVFQVRGGRLFLQEDGSEQELPGSPIEALRAARREIVPVPQPELPRFTGGLVGFFSYDFVRCLERLPQRSEDDLRIPQAVLAEYDTVLAFEHPRNRLILMSAVHLGGGREPRRRSYQAACERLDELARQLSGPLPDLGAREPGRMKEAVVQAVPSDEEFLENVEKAREYIRAGDIFQVVLSRRFSRPWAGSPLSVYRVLRSLNPSPYHVFLACDGDYVAGASPEMLVRVLGRQITVRPIAGTRPRGKDATSDRQLEVELLADTKERAEHLMLVDLARNDVGRVSHPGTVRVDDFALVERYSHVMHLVSSVSGELQEGKDALDAFSACFPAGTLTGAPKVRAMEIIEESEPFRRGPYGGAVAYLDHGGDLDSCITIRTVVLSGGQAHVQAGAGIVADSKAENERWEITPKAEVMMAALRQAAEGLP